MALACFAERAGRSANEQTQTEARITVTPVSGEGGLWAYYGRVPIAGHAYHEQPAAVPSPAVEAADDVQPSLPVHRPELPVPEPPAPRGDWRDLVAGYDWPVWEALSVIRCESSGNPLAANGTSIGLFQINTAAHPYTYAQMIDPAQNIAAAYKIWSDGRSWSAWSCSPY